jgi:hypothetical protein
MEASVKLLRIAMIASVLAGAFVLGAFLAGAPGGVGVALIGYFSGLPQRVANHISAGFEQ